MTREEMIQRLVDEVHALTDDDIEALSKFGYNDAKVMLMRTWDICERKQSHSASIGEALYNVDSETKTVGPGESIPPGNNKVRRDIAWGNRVKQTRGK